MEKYLNKNIEDSFKFKDSKVYIQSGLKKVENNYIWFDNYQFNNDYNIFEYPVKIYNSVKELEKYLNQCNLKIEKIIINYNKKYISDDG